MDVAQTRALVGWFFNQSVETKKRRVKMAKKTEKWEASVDAEVLRWRLEGICTDMSRVMTLTSGSPILTEANDYQTYICDPEGTMLATGEALAWFFLACRTTIGYIRGNVSEINDQDFFMTNDVFTCGGFHPSDVIITKPIFHNGEIVAWAWTGCHVLDIGGVAPGGWAVGARDCWGEALRFPPNTKLVEKGLMNQGLVNVIMTNTRMPSLMLGDLRAMIGACNRAERGLKTILDEKGAEKFHILSDEIVRASESVVRSRAKKLPRGQYFRREFQEDDGWEEKLFESQMWVEAKDDTVYTRVEAGPYARGLINAPAGSYIGCGPAMYVPFNFAPDIPLNSGIFSPFEFDLQDGTMVNAHPPACVSSAHMDAALHGGRTFQGLLARMMAHATSPELRFRTVAPDGACFQMSVWMGMDQFGGFTLFATFDGGAAGKGAECIKDGLDAGGLAPGIVHIGDVEFEEQNSPVLYLWRGYHKNGGGPGLFRGGCALDEAWIPWDTEWLQGTLNAAVGSVPSEGVLGGLPGSGGYWGVAGGVDVVENFFKKGIVPTANDLEGQCESVRLKASPMLTKQDMFYWFISGGTGLGDPLLREPAIVARDAKLGFISLKHAKEAYGVVLSPQTLEVDSNATERQRQLIREARIGKPTKAKVKPRTVNAKGEPIHPWIDVVKKDGKEWFVCCQCDNDLCVREGAEDWMRTGTIARVEPIVSYMNKMEMYVRPRENPRVMVREIACPHCGALLWAEVIPETYV